MLNYCHDLFTVYLNVSITKFTDVNVRVVVSKWIHGSSTNAKPSDEYEKLFDKSKRKQFNIQFKKEKVRLVRKLLPNLNVWHHGEVPDDMANDFIVKLGKIASHRCYHSKAIHHNYDSL